MFHGAIEPTKSLSMPKSPSSLQCSLLLVCHFFPFHCVNHSVVPDENSYLYSQCLIRSSSPLPVLILVSVSSVIGSGEVNLPQESDKLMLEPVIKGSKTYQGDYDGAGDMALYEVCSKLYCSVWLWHLCMLCCLGWWLLEQNEDGSGKLECWPSLSKYIFSKRWHCLITVVPVDVVGSQSLN